jgi:hypothetical protein
MTPTLLETIEVVVARSGDVDDVLRATVRRLVEEPGVAWAGIRFVEGDELVLGPAAGVERDAQAVTTTIAYRGAPVGELVVHGDADPAVLARVAELVAPYVLLGWDTGGEAWSP